MWSGGFAVFRIKAPVKHASPTRGSAVRQLSY